MFNMGIDGARHQTNHPPPLPDSRGANHGAARLETGKVLNEFLAGSPLFAHLKTSERTELATLFDEHPFGIGEVLVAPGEVFNALFLIVSGTLRIHRRLGTDDEVARVGAGECFGITSALSAIPLRIQVTALSDGVVCSLQRAFNVPARVYSPLMTLPQRFSDMGRQVDRDVYLGKPILRVLRCLTQAR